MVSIKAKGIDNSTNIGENLFHTLCLSQINKYKAFCIYMLPLKEEEKGRDNFANCVHARHRAYIY